MDPATQTGPAADALIADEPYAAPLVSDEVMFAGPIFVAHRETFDLGEAGRLTRDIARHAPAVAVVVLDEDDRVLLIQQYRHAVGSREWELPAGLVDDTDASLLEAAVRELHEEADIEAREWHLLLEHRSSPGFTDEVLTTFLARGITSVPEHSRYLRNGEELGMPTRWVPIDDVVGAALDGRIHNVTAIASVLAAAAARDRGWASLRPADA